MSKEPISDESLIGVLGAVAFLETLRVSLTTDRYRAVEALYHRTPEGSA